MATAANALIQIEAGQNQVTWEQATDAGNHQTFSPSAAIISAAVAPQIRPDGVVTGTNLLSAGTAADTVDVAAFTAYSGGTLLAVAPETLTITRPGTDVALVASITMTSEGQLAVIAGTAGSSADFSEDRGEAGGPPFIPVGSVEIGQIRMRKSASAVLAADEIYQNGNFTERADFPVYTVSNIGAGDSATGAGETHAHIKFADPLPLSHGSGETKAVWLQYSVPSFADIPRALDFVPVETTHSASSTAYYGGATASASSSLGQGSFTVLCDDGITDFIVAQKNKDVTVKFFANRAAAPYIVTQGKLALARTFPVDNQIQANCTITSGAPSAEFSG